MAEAEQMLGHGMGTNLEVKDWQPVHHADLLHLQQYYPILQGQLTIIWHSPRPFSSACMVRNGAQDYLIKRSHCSFRSVQDLLEEHAFIGHLAKQGIAVAHLYKHLQGSTALQLGQWVYEIQQKIVGVDCYVDRPSWTTFIYPHHAWGAGQSMARLHQAAQCYAVGQGRTSKLLLANQRLIEQPNVLHALQQRIAESHVLAQYFAEQPLSKTFLQHLQDWHQPLQAPLAALAKIWTHNDLHASNFIWSDTSSTASIAAVIDFGLCDLCSAAYDIATTIERNFFDWFALSQSDAIAIDYAGLAALLNGYLHQSNDHPQLLILPQLLPVVHLDFALYELEYFLLISQNLTHAKAAHAYLVEHLCWFTRAEGQAFLARLQHLIQETIDARSTR